MKLSPSSIFARLIITLAFTLGLDNQPACSQTDTTNNDTIDSTHKELRRWKSIGIGAPFIIPAYLFGLYSTWYDNTKFKTRNYSSYQYLWPSSGQVRYDEPSNMIPYLNFAKSSKNDSVYYQFSLRIFHYKKRVDPYFHFGGGINELAFSISRVKLTQNPNIQFTTGLGFGPMFSEPKLRGDIADNGGYVVPLSKTEFFTYQLIGIGGSVNAGALYNIHVIQLKNSEVNIQLQSIFQLHSHITKRITAIDGNGDSIFDQSYFAFGGGILTGITFNWRFE